MLEMKENENQPWLKNFILNLILTCNMHILCKNFLHIC